MPWCESCGHHWANAAPRCPQCGAEATQGAVAQAAADRRQERSETADQPRAPWHFKLMLVGVIGYLGWRAIEGVVWLVDQVL